MLRRQKKREQGRQPLLPGVKALTMDIVTKKYKLRKNVEIRNIGKNTWLVFFLREAYGMEWIDYGLPQPAFISNRNAPFGIVIGWILKGVFATRKQQEFYADIVARTILTLKNHSPERMSYYPIYRGMEHIHLEAKVEAKEFARSLKSLYWEKEKRGIKVLKKADTVGNDAVFWAIKWWTEDYIRQHGGPIPYSTLEAWAFTTFSIGEGQDVKDRSTLRAKCRSVWNWYSDRGWTIPNRRKGMLTREEHAKELAKKKEEHTIRKLTSLLTGLYAKEYYKKNGKINISKLAKDAGISRTTAYKHLPQILESIKGGFQRGE